MSDRLAILVGNGRFECEASLPELFGPRCDVAALGGLLSDPELGNFVVFELLDHESGQLQPELERAFGIGHPEATVIFYYAGYVVAEPGRGLLLATADTELVKVKNTALPLSWIKRQLRACGARNIVVILDCCYAGASGSVDQVHIEQELRRIRSDVGPDVHVLASPATDQTQEAREIQTEAGHEGRLTHCMVEGLATGAADRDGDNRTGVRDLNEYFGIRLSEGRPLWSGPLEGADPEIVANPHPIEGIDLGAFRPIGEVRPPRRRVVAAAAAGALLVMAGLAGFVLTRSEEPPATRVEGYYAGSGMPEDIALLDNLERLHSTVNRTGWIEHLEPLDGTGPRYVGAMVLRLDSGNSNRTGTVSLGLRRWAEIDFGPGVHGFGVACAVGLNAAEVEVELANGRRYRFDVRAEHEGREFFGFVSRGPIRRARITATSTRFVADRLYLYADKEFDSASAAGS